MWIALTVLASIAVAAGVFVAKGRGSPAAPPPTEPPTARAATAATAAPPRARTPVAATPLDPSQDLKMVCCQVHGAMHGAMPPFGKLQLTPTGLLFEATSRVISKAGDALDSSDGATTMQSLGSMEMGQFRFEIPRSATQKVEFRGAKATLWVDDAVFELEGLGPSGGVLANWLKANGFDS